MTPERYKRVGELFDQALELAPADRSAFLRQAGGDDTELRIEVEKLLAHHTDSEEFLSRPALDVAAAQLAQNQKPSLLGQTISHYRILSLLGTGGMGEVYLAEDTTLRRKSALKVLPATIAQDKERLRRFEQEAFAASALNHPNILTIFEFGAEGEAHFLASELVQGETLRARIQRGALSLSETLDITVQIASALHAAHEAGIIHRDIKPENVMIRNDGLVKVLDFGLAKLTETRKAERGTAGTMKAEGGTRNEEENNGSEVHRSSFCLHPSTMPGMILGTVAYMSPEQARGKVVDARTDLFSLGVVLYEMLTGSRPFTGETISHTIVAILEKEPPPLAVTGQPFPDEIEQIVKQTLAKQVERRYQSAAALLADLKKLKQRLEFEAELAITSPLSPASEIQTQIFEGKPHELAATTTLSKAVSASPLELALYSEQAVNDVVQTPVSALARRKPIWLVSVLLAAGLISVFLWPGWQALRSRLVTPPAQGAAALPEWNLSYFLTVQKYRDGKPYQTEFQSSGREIFEPGWQFKLNFFSPQEGFLYLLNEEPAARGSNYVLLFPIPSHNNGSAHLARRGRTAVAGVFGFHHRNFLCQSGPERKSD